MEIAERTEEVAGLDVRRLRAGDAPVLYVHGVPNSADMWRPFLERTGGVALDLPGFGGSAKRGDFDYSIAGYDRFLEAFVDAIGLDRFALVLHDWGSVALATAQRFPERIERLVISSAVPFLPGYRWHRIARAWRRPLVGELFMGFATRWGLKQLSKRSNVAAGPLPADFIDQIWRYFDQGTQRTILKLYRSAPEPILARAGEGLGGIRCPALVVWGSEDPYLPTEFAHGYANALGGPVQVEIAEAGHWPWLDEPELVARVAGFVA